MYIISKYENVDDIKRLKYMRRNYRVFTIVESTDKNQS